MLMRNVESVKEENYLNLDADFKLIPAFSIPGSGNAIIEGDNLSSLYLLDRLAETNLPFVDLMYWDPPYNTGSKGFYYNDDRSILESGESHWAQFISSRMEYARFRLKETGAIAVHIDERELWRLAQIMDKVFGHQNFFTLITWHSSKGGGKKLSNTTEYILVYAKNISQLRDALPHVTYPTKNAHNFTNPDNDPKGPWRGKVSSGRNRKQQYEIEDFTRPGVFVKPTYGWRHTPKKMIGRFAGCGIAYDYDKTKDRLFLVATPVLNGVLPRYYFRDGVLRKKEYLYERNTRHGSLHTLIDNRMDGPGILAAEGVKTFRAVTGVNPLAFDFETVKPLAMVKKIVRHLCPENGLVVDAFAGMGTTAQAVLELNRDLGHSRRFILIECGGWQKDGISFTVNDYMAERIRRVISGNWHSGPQLPTGSGFNYYQLINNSLPATLPPEPHYFYVDELIENSNSAMRLIKIGITKEAGCEQRRKDHHKKYAFHFDDVKILKDWSFESKKAAENFEGNLQAKLKNRQAFRQNSDEVFRLNDQEIADLLSPKTAEELRTYVEQM